MGLSKLKGGEYMKKITKILICVVAIVLIAIPTVMSSIELTGATCNRVDISFPIQWHGYNCIESSGIIRGFLEPDAYNNMIAYYVPPLEQTSPEYTFVTGGQTETLSGQ